MNDDNMLRLRRAVMRLLQKTEGESVTFKLEGSDPTLMRKEAVAFGRKKKVGVRVENHDDNLVLFRDESVFASRYSLVEKLEIGQNTLMAVSQDQEQSVRVGVSQLGRRLGRRFSCSAGEGGVTVTRLALEAPVMRGRKPTVAANRHFDALETLQARLWVDIDAGADIATVTSRLNAARLAVASFGRLKGWELMTRIMPAASGEPVRLRVFRLDHPAEGPMPPALSAATVQAWADRHDLQGNATELREIFDDARTLRE